MLSDTIPPDSARLLHNWRVMEAVSPEGQRTRHICGQNLARNAGVSTSPIVEFDRQAMAVKTRSGRVYTLMGAPGMCHLGEAAWNKWCNDNKIVERREVTDEYTSVPPEPTITFRRLGIQGAS